jgi:CDP-diacylglycerol--glycerol-3-phosphate 3-phosphatidyltransferase/cardiolipin synthase
MGLAFPSLCSLARIAYEGAVLSSLPNLLTLSRILAVPGLVWLMWGKNPWYWLAAFILYSIAGITDYLDGYLARAQGTVSKLGQFLDPIADKIMVAAVIVMLIRWGIIHDLSVLAALVILLREIMVSGLREYLAGVRVSVPVSQLAKWKTACQMFALGALILYGSDPVIAFLPGWVALHAGIATLWVAAILTLITGYDYLRIGLKHM